MRGSIAAAVSLMAFVLVGESHALAQAAQSCDGRGPIVAAPDTQTLCTKLVAFHGVCGKPNFPGIAGYEDVAIYLNPWEEESITLRQVQVSTVLQGPILNGQPQAANLNIGVFSGNSYNYDPMTPYEFANSFGAKMIVVKAHERFPAGTGMQFPGKLTNARTGPQGARLDVHVDCAPDGASYEGRWFLAYTINRRR